MKMQWLAVTAMLFVVNPLSAEEQKAKTDDGRTVILKSDGTWKYADKEKADEEKKEKGVFKKDPKSEVQYTGKQKNFTLSFEPKDWQKKKKSRNEAAEVCFDHKDGDVYTMVIAEKLEIPIESLKKIAIDNMKAAASDTKVVVDEERTVNGLTVTCLIFEATVANIPFTYYNYYYAGEEGSFQLLTYCGRKTFKKNKAKMENFLNSFEVITSKEETEEKKDSKEMPDDK